MQAALSSDLYREAVVATIHTTPAIVNKKAKREFKKGHQTRNQRC